VFDYRDYFFQIYCEMLIAIFKMQEAFVEVQNYLIKRIM